MPDSDGVTGSTTKHNGRKRPSQGRVVPAIPLALSKSRPIKSQPKAEELPLTSETNAVQAVQSSSKPVDGADGDDVVPSTPETNEVKRDGDSAEHTTNGVNHSATDTPGSRDSVQTPLLNGDDDDDSSTAILQTPASVETTPNEAAPTVVSPSGARRFDMRPLRTQLPPAFVPSAERYTPQSASSPWQDQHPHLRNRTHHPSTSSIVFGAHDSSTSSPLPPQSADSNAQSQQWPPLGAKPPPSTSAPSAHAHHASEPFPLRGQQGIPHSAWQMRPNHYSQMQQHLPHPVHASFRYPPREVFTPAEEGAPNRNYARSRSISQTSAKVARTGDELQSPFAGDVPDGVKYMPREHRAPFQPTPPNLRQAYYGQAPPSFPQHEQTLRFENAEAIRHHVQSQYGNPLLADCHLQILEYGEGGQQYLDAHKIILSRSPRLLDLIQSSDPPASADLKLQVHIPLRGPYIRIRELTECIQYLYGGPLGALEQLRHPHATPEGPMSNDERMQGALQYVATAAWLQLPVIAGRAMGIALSFLHWDTVPAVLAFSLDGGLGPAFTVEDGSEVSCSSSDDSLGRPDGIGIPTYDPYSTDLLHRVIDFTVHMFPPNFYLDAAAPQLPPCPRLPSMPHSHESKASRSDPRLSQIRFGELSQEDHGRPSAGTTNISSILLSLPFALLKCILEHNGLVFQLGADTVASIMRQVIAERENRRKRILTARTASQVQVQDGTDLQLIQNLYFEEAVEPSSHHRAGFRLARKKRGVDTPPSSGAVSEQRE
ncbi:hypothetical protein LTR78_007121 [Recurvomyces mirabilis]|uniref:BTB domain-containing protein n=1 Tax=Recurvomyces mirabilis TaxID=574656 RepID=A0AAE0WJS8_9PEZI|nr:hypothetical protein LTR78_007121 [Recurvomyces mirabilis]KAK5150907.1 hypothetical protein LTS14_009710 [Recurvomyces mirabilis]